MLDRYRYRYHWYRADTDTTDTDTNSLINVIEIEFWLGLKKKTWDSYNPTDPKLSSDPISYFYFLCKFWLNYANLCKF